MKSLFKYAGWIAGFIAVCVLAVGVRLEYVHRNTGEWRTRPTAVPGLLRFEGHYYHRVRRDPHRDPGFQKKALDLGGGEVFMPFSTTGTPAAGTPQVIQVRSSRHYYGYRLIS